MTKTFLFISFILLFFSCQEKTLFKKGLRYYKLAYKDYYKDYYSFNFDDFDKKLSEEELLIQKKKEETKQLKKVRYLNFSLQYFEELINHYPNSIYLYRSLNNAASISDELEFTEKAIKYYKILLSSKANDMESGGVGSGIMADPYAMYKNRACKILAELYIEKEEYEEALDYLFLLKNHPYQHFCGNELAADEIYVATLYTLCYQALNNLDKALEISLPYVFYNGLTNNTEILKITINILKTHYTQNELDAELQNTLNNIQLIKKDEHLVGMTAFFDVELKISFLEVASKDFDFKKYRQLSEMEKQIFLFKNSRLYKELKK